MTGIIIQSRLGSRRLPRKAFLLLDGKPMIQHVVERCLATEFPVVLAVPEGDGEEFKDILKSMVQVYEGHPTDVLDRYYEVMKAFAFDPIIRITGDCPLIDPGMIKRMADMFELDSCSYLSNCHPVRTVPSGLDVEIFTSSLLAEAQFNAHLPYYREHVTPFMYESRKRCCQTYAPPFPDSWKVSIDTTEDYERVRKMMEEKIFPWSVQ